MKNVTLIRGHAQLKSARSVSVGGETLAAEKIFINVRGRERLPEFPGLADFDYLTNSGIMDIDSVPEHLVIVGGSYIGLEFAQMYRRFGAEFTVIEMQDRLIAREDEDVSDTVHEMLEDEGVKVRPGAECLGFERGPKGIRMNIHCDEDATPIDGSHLLMAVGRTPNTGCLGLNGDEVVHGLLDVMYARKSYTTISRAVHISHTLRAESAGRTFSWDGGSRGCPGVCEGIQLIMNGWVGNAHGDQSVRLA